VFRPQRDAAPHSVPADPAFRSACGSTVLGSKTLALWCLHRCSCARATAVEVCAKTGATPALCGTEVRRRVPRHGVALSWRVKLQLPRVVLRIWIKISSATACASDLPVIQKLGHRSLAAERSSEWPKRRTEPPLPLMPWTLPPLWTHRARPQATWKTAVRFSTAPTAPLFFLERQC
jgi:hypothetical protein